MVSLIGLLVALVLTLGLLEAGAQQRGALGGSLPPDATAGAFRGPLPPGATPGLVQGTMPSEVSKGALRGSVPSDTPTGVFRGSVPPGATTGVFRAPIPSGVATGTLTTPPETLPPTDQATLLENQLQMSLTDGALADAEATLKRSLRIREEAQGSEHADIAQTLETYADLLRRRGRPTEAEDVEARAKTIRAAQGR